MFCYWVNFYRTIKHGVVVWNISNQIHFSIEEEIFHKPSPARKCSLEIFVPYFLSHCINTYIYKYICSWCNSAGMKIIDSNATQCDCIMCTKGHLFCKQCLHDLQFMKTRSSSPNLSKLARVDISCQFKKTRSLCRTVYKINGL